jgi:Family of unknown function (DUF6011)
MFNTANIQSTRVTRGPRDEGIAKWIQDLEQAAARFNLRRDQFAAGKGDICLDLAAKLERFGSFASSKQQEFAGKLVAWSQPRATADWGRPVPKLFAVMQKHATLHVDPLKLSRRNQDSLVWIMYEGQCVGKIEDERATVWKGKAESAGTTPLAVLAIVEEFEADPLGAAKKHGQASGRCCSCGRDLTDPESIAAGIGPICATKFGGF